jgi:glutamate-5-semialdehyde dehydrogenase
MAANSNDVLAAVAMEAGAEAGLPEGWLAPISGGGHEELEQLATQDGLVDLIVPRGGEGLKAALKGVATVPVIYAASGNCHVYVDASASLQDALAIVLNAKTQRPGVCNAAETLLVHDAIAAEFLPGALAALDAAGVELRGDDRVRQMAGRPEVAAASEEDWATEYHSLTLAVGVVGSVEEAIDHINRYGSGHSDAIVTRLRVRQRVHSVH